MLFKILMLYKLLEMTGGSRVIDSTSQRSVYVNDFCPKMKYCAEGAHVMCMYYNAKSHMGPRCSNPQNITMTPALANKMVDVSNAIRSRIAQGKEKGKNGEQLPRGYGMFRLHWDAELATFAQVLANQCVLRHDLCRATHRFPDPGQTAGLVRFSYPEWFPVSKSGNFTETGLNPAKLMYATTQILKSWYGQKSAVTPNMITFYPDWTLTPNNQNGRLYLEMIYGSATHMGCGISAYTEYAFYDNHAALNYNSVQIICNYSGRPRKGTAVYNTVPPGDTDVPFNQCGCPAGSVADHDCLCKEEKKPVDQQVLLKHDTFVCPDGDICEPTVVVLPIVTVEDAPPEKLFTHDSQKPSTRHHVAAIKNRYLEKKHIESKLPERMQSWATQNMVREPPKDIAQSWERQIMMGESPKDVAQSLERQNMVRDPTKDVTQFWTKQKMAREPPKDVAQSWDRQNMVSKPPKDVAQSRNRQNMVGEPPKDVAQSWATQNMMEKSLKDGTQYWSRQNMVSKPPKDVAQSRNRQNMVGEPPKDVAQSWATQNMMEESLKDGTQYWSRQNMVRKPPKDVVQSWAIQNNMGEPPKDVAQFWATQSIMGESAKDGAQYWSRQNMVREPPKDVAQSWATQNMMGESQKDGAQYWARQNMVKQSLKNGVQSRARQNMESESKPQKGAHSRARQNKKTSLFTRVDKFKLPEAYHSILFRPTKDHRPESKTPHQIATEKTIRDVIPRKDFTKAKKLVDKYLYGEKETIKPQNKPVIEAKTDYYNPIKHEDKPIDDHNALFNSIHSSHEIVLPKAKTHNMHSIFSDHETFKNVVDHERHLNEVFHILKASEPYKSSREIVRYQQSTTESVLHTAENDLITHHNFFKDIVNTSNDLNSVTEETDSKLMALLDTLEQEVKHVELRDKNKQLFDAKIRKIYGKVVGKPVNLEDINKNTPNNKSNDKHVDDANDSYTQKHIQQDYAQDSYTQKYFQQDQKEENFEKRNRINNIAMDDETKPETTDKMTEKYSSLITDIINRNEPDRFEEHHSNRYSFRGMKDGDISHEELRKRFRSLENEELIEGKSFNTLSEMDEPRQRPNKYQGRYEKRRYRADIERRGKKVSRPITEDEQIRNKNYYLANDANNDDPMSFERRRFYQEKLDNMERRLRNHKRRKNNPSHNMRPMRPARKSEHQMDLYGRARFAHGY